MAHKTYTNGDGSKVTVVGPLAKWVIGGLCSVIILLLVAGGRHLDETLMSIQKSVDCVKTSVESHEKLIDHPVAQIQEIYQEKRLDKLEAACVEITESLADIKAAVKNGHN